DFISEYSLPDLGFVEAPANDGSVLGSVLVKLEGETFTSAANVESNLTISNLPVGLTPSVALSVGNTVATITLVGNAVSNESADNVADLQFTFANGAFSGGDASVVNNAVGANTGLGISFQDSNPFITTWVTTDGEIRFPGNGTYNIAWFNETNAGVGDGSAGNVSGIYDFSGLENGSTYRVEVTGGLTSVEFGNATAAASKPKIQTIEQWGEITWTTMLGAFASCSNLTYNAVDAPDLSGVTSMESMFQAASSFNGDISGWDVSTITNMRRMFYNADAFNQNISAWDVSSVVNMEGMFQLNDVFNNGGAILNWGAKTSLVQNTDAMFQEAPLFNQDVSSWDMSSNRDAARMFQDATAFNNGGVAMDWGGTTAAIETTGNMFQNATSFNQDVSTWDMSSNMALNSMFNGASSFNNGGVPLDWSVIGDGSSSSLSFNDIFQDATSFNQPIDTWVFNNTGSVGFARAFEGASAFNQDLSAWDVSRVSSISGAFRDATAFNQDLGSWDISGLSILLGAFDNSGLDIANYDATLIGWADDNGGSETIQTGRSLGAVGLIYSAAGKVGRDILTGTFGWTITGDATAPQAVTDLIAYESGGNIELIWSDVPDEDNYDIERATDYAFSAPVVVATDIGVSSNSFTVTTPQPNQYYRVVAKNLGGSTPSSPEFASTNPFPGQALLFDGNDDYVEIPDDPSLNRSVITMEAWFRTTMTGVGKIMGKGNGTVQKYDLTMGFPSSGRVAFASNDGISSRSVGSTTLFNDGLWHHVAGILDETTDRMEIYVDGVLQDSDNAYVNTSVVSTLPFYLGVNNVETFDGQLDEFRIWDFAKTDFSDRFAPLQGNEAGLVAYYPIDEGIGATNTVDRSQNTNDGTLNGGVASVLSEAADNVVPTFDVANSTPTDDAVDVLVGDDIVLDFSENILAGTGSINLKIVAGASIETFDITTATNTTTPAAGAIGIDLDKIYINPTSDLLGATNYAIQFPAGLIIDNNGNQVVAVADDIAFNFTTEDNVPPVLVSSTPVDNATAIATADNIVLNFDENIVFGTGNIQVIDLTDGSNSFTIDAAAPGGEAGIAGNVLTINPAADLDEQSDYAIQIAATAIDDAVGNSYAGIADNTTLNFTTADETPPSLTSFSRQTPLTANTNADALVFRAIFNEAVTGVDAADFAIDGTSTATVTGVATVDPSTYDVTISGGDLATFNGTVGLDLNSPTITDIGGNPLPNVEPGIDEVYTLDNTAPTVAIGAPTPTTGNSGTLVSFPVTYTGATAINLTNVDVVINHTGTSGGTVNVVNGTTATPTVEVSGVLGDGSYTISINPGTSSDAATNPDVGAGPSGSVTIDNTAPTVAIGAPTPTTGNSGTLVSFPVTYTGATAINLTNVDVTINHTGTSGGTVNVVNGTTATPTVEVSGVLGDGSYTISISPGTSSDAAINPDLGAGPSGSVTIDNTVPTVAIGAPTPTTGNSGTLVSFPVTYTGATAINLTNVDVVINHTGTSGGTVNVVNGTTGTPTVEVSGVLGDGTYTISINPGTSSDVASNPDAGAGPSGSVTIDNTVPTAVSFARQVPLSANTNADVLTFRATFSEGVLNIDAGDFTVNSTSTATVTGVATVSASEYDVTISGGDLAGFDGTVGLDLFGSSDITDVLGNALTIAEPGIDETYTVDNSSFSATIARLTPLQENTNAGSVTFRVTFTEDVVNVDVADFLVSIGSVVNVTQNTASEYDVDIDGVSGDGLLDLDFAGGQDI
ncbi:MAG: BspA family leucine-rich repeat surface protein, partial [Ekhidna sp.]|nr:BspA family leucine-rich repeat surface protein [Ekhidna sp.]